MVDKELIKWDMMNKNNKLKIKKKSHQRVKTLTKLKDNRLRFNALQKDVFKGVVMNLDRLLDDYIETDNISTTEKIYNELYSINDSFYDNLLDKFITTEQNRRKVRPKLKPMILQNLTQLSTHHPLDQEPIPRYNSILKANDKTVPNQHGGNHISNNNLQQVITDNNIGKEDENKMPHNKPDKYSVIDPKKSLKKKTKKNAVIRQSEATLNKLPLIHDKLEEISKRENIKESVSKKKKFCCLPFICF